MSFRFLTCGMVFGMLGFYGAYGVGINTVSTGDSNARIGTNLVANTNGYNGKLRGNQATASAYKNYQKSTYFIMNQLDVDTACRERIYKCLSDYCGDATIIPGQTYGRCQYATESELYNYALLCLQKDFSNLLPQYSVGAKGAPSGMNTAARLCPPYVQQELISYLSMSNMATQLSKSHSDLCLKRRQELEAAMSCHAVALSYGNSTNSMLVSQLTDACGAGVPGGSAEMVTRFSNAGNLGADVLGWAEKIAGLSFNQKGDDWQIAVDNVLVGYTNRMNVACGDNVQMNQITPTNSNGTGALQTVATLALAGQVQQVNVANPYETQPIYYEVTSRTEVYDYQTANQVVQAGLTNSALSQNSYLTGAQMDDMQNAYKRGSKVFVLRDGIRCYVVPVTTLSATETSLIAQSFSTCVSR